MVVSDRQESFLLRRKPACIRQALALCTTTPLATAVPHAHQVTVLTIPAVATKQRRAAGSIGLQRIQLIRRDLVISKERLQMLTEYGRKRGFHPVAI